jgi:hypothetical protein
VVEIVDMGVNGKMWHVVMYEASRSAVLFDGESQICLV